MNKVICDVCGTAYPETSSQCPICGCAKVSSQAAAPDSPDEETTAYSYVKGGRFSKKNVKARTKRSKTQDTGRDRGQEPEEGKPNKGLVAVVVLLLLAIVAVIIYISIQFFDFELPTNTNPNQSTQSTDNTQPSNDSTEPSETVGVPCTSLILSNGTLEFLSVGDKWTLKAEVEPVDCTEGVVYTSADPTIATVSETGEVLAVGPGETVITATCGTMSAECKVLCNFTIESNPVDSTDPTESTGNGDFSSGESKTYTISSEDMTLEEGGSWWLRLKDSDGNEVEGVSWTADKDGYVKIEGNKLTGVKSTSDLPKKYVMVSCTYEGETYSCIVRIKPGKTANPTEGDDTDSNETKAYKISTTDMTLKVDESWWLKLKDSSGNEVEGVTWTADKDGYVKIEGNKLTGVKNTNDLSKKYVTVSCTYEGETYSCIVRVKNA